MTEIDWDNKKQDWISKVNDLTNEIEGWATEKKWLSDRQDKKIFEEHLGNYKVPLLTIITPQGRVMVDPVGRNIIGAEGRVDLLAFPSYKRMLLVKLDNEWIVKTDSIVAWPSSWNKTTFYELIDALTAD